LGDPLTEAVVRDLEWGDFADLVRNYLALYDEVRTNPDLGITLFEKPPTMSEEVGWFASLYRSILDGDAVSAVAVFEGHVVGVCTVRRKGPAHESRHFGGLGIFVEKASRGQGIGRALMHHVLERCRGRFEFIELSVFSSNARARELYQSLGFRTWGTLPKAILREGKYGDSEHMVLALEPRTDA
jgi:RimJ/RimL family protein N-acetyltransferase